MYQDINESFIDYYNERASEYDDIYLGKAPGTLDAQLYEKDIKKVGELCKRFGSGQSIDIGCGTGFWLSYYAANCKRVILIDQSEKMLSECRTRVDKLGLNDKCHSS
jgi:cyclopropane fatty-acyl-phospholipid synthase-like methyltransferase